MPIYRKFFFDQIRKSLFDGKMSASQVGGITAILDEWETDHWQKDDRWLAYALATTFHETNLTMQPVREAYWLSEAWRKKNLRYYPYYGRGDIQLTWLANYKKMSEVFGVDFVKNPDWVMKPEYAAKIMFYGMENGSFTTKKLSNYFSSTKDDPVRARAIINGKDKQNLIAQYHYKFYAAISYTT